MPLKRAPAGRPESDPHMNDPKTDIAIQVPAEILRRMIEHCRSDAPLEACGLLTGRPPTVLAIEPLRNELASPTLYQADSRDLIAAIVAIRGRGESIVAIYHSHPASGPTPSRTDLRTNYYGEVPRVIVSLLDDPPEVRTWILEPDSYREVSMEVVPSVDPPAGSH